MFQSRCLSIVMPRYLYDFTHSIFCSFILMLIGFLRLLFLVNRIDLHFLAVKLSLCFPAHVSIFLIAFCRIDTVVDRSFPRSRAKMSSANMYNFILGSVMNSFSRSSFSRLKRIGLRLG